MNDRGYASYYQDDGMRFMQGTIVLTLSDQACQGAISEKSGKCHWRNTTLRRDESTKRRCSIQLRKVFILFQIYIIGDARELPHKNDIQPSDLPVEYHELLARTTGSKPTSGRRRD